MLRRSNNISGYNLNDIWNILDKYPRTCKKIFTNNLKTLKIKYISEEELAIMSNDPGTEGMYVPIENTIYITKENIKNKRVINHELFHTTSTHNRKIGIIGKIELNNHEKIIGENLDEGITEYLALKSLNKRKSNTSYQLEVFVIKCLINIYGSKILIPYFKNSPEKFYQQFKNDNLKIIKLDILLNKLSKYEMLTDIFEEYLLLLEINTNSLKENNLLLNTTSLKQFLKDLSKNQDTIIDYYKKEENTNPILIELNKTNNTYELKNKKAEYLYIDWYNQEKILIEKILKIIIILARKNNLSDELIKKILMNNLKYTNDTLELIRYKNKKLIRKE